VQSGDDASRRRLLEEFEKHGLTGAVTDFGQILLLFERGNQERYEFLPVDERLLGAERCTVFAYRQGDGPGALTVWEDKDRLQSRVEGEIWVSTDGYRLERITLKSIRTEASGPVRDDAEVDYVMTSHGVLAPAAVTHREYRGGQLTTENLFTYTTFQRFGASAKIKFTESPERAK
jgi:hypothetical protein